MILHNTFRVFLWDSQNLLYWFIWFQSHLLQVWIVPSCVCVSTDWAQFYFECIPLCSSAPQVGHVLEILPEKSLNPANYMNVYTSIRDGLFLELIFINYFMCISVILVLAYSGLFNVVIRQKLGINPFFNFAPGVEMMLLRKILISSRLLWACLHHSNSWYDHLPLFTAFDLVLSFQFLCCIQIWCKSHLWIYLAVSQTCVLCFFYSAAHTLC